MSVCFYHCADQLEAHAAELETVGAQRDPNHTDSARRLRRLADEIRRDTTPCPSHPGCGCGAHVRTPARRDG